MLGTRSYQEKREKSIKSAIMSRTGLGAAESLATHDPWGFGRTHLDSRAKKQEHLLTHPLSAPETLALLSKLRLLSKRVTRE